MRVKCIAWRKHLPGQVMLLSGVFSLVPVTALATEQPGSESGGLDFKRFKTCLVMWASLGCELPPSLSCSDSVIVSSSESYGMHRCFRVKLPVLNY